MTRAKQIFAIVALSVGCLGIVVCLAGMVSAWSLSSQLHRTTDDIFATLDGTLETIHDRSVQAHKHIRASKITTDEIATTLKDWTKRKMGRQVAQRLDIDEKTAHLASALQQADHALTVSESAVKLVRQTLLLLNSTGAPTDPATVDRLIEELSSLHSRLDEATRIVADIHDRTSEEIDKKTLKQRLGQAAQLAARVAVTLGAIDSRLEEFTNRLAKTRERIQELQAEISRNIWYAAIIAELLIVWMAAGQVAICLLALLQVGWRLNAST